MSTEAWIFVVGFRVFDVGLLIVWLVWFFRLRDDGSEPPEGGGGGGGGGSPKPSPRRGPGGGGVRLPTGRWRAGWRRRDGHRPRRSRRRGAPGEPLPRVSPARVRFPAGVPARLSPRR